MGVCDLVRDTSNGLQNAAGKAASGLGSVLSALGAADIGIKLGTGGKAGVSDLPRLIAEEKGIECYSSELGESIYVTPFQWYANGMKCDGLRDLDKESLKKVVEDFEKKIQEKQRVKNSNSTLLPAGAQNLLPPHRRNMANPFSNGTTKVFFDKEGILKVEGSSHESFWSTVSGSLERLESNFPWYKELLIRPGQYLEFCTRTGTYDNFFAWAIFLVFNSSFSSLSSDEKMSNRQPGLASFLSYNYYKNSYIGPEYTPVAWWGINPVTTRFFPFDSPSIPKLPVVIINSPPRGQDFEDLCSMTCSCGQIGQMLKQQQRINGNIEQLIKEIHKAVAASLFVARSPYYPEQNIEKIGKKLYSGHPGRGGNASVGNLLEAVESLVSAHYHRSGLHRFPANVPDSLIPKTNAALEAIDRDYVDIYDMAGFLEWMAKVEDERAGEWPIKFKITDDGKEKDVFLWNQAEAIADIYGAILKIVEDSDQSVHWGLRATTEASKAGNAGLKVLHLLQEVVKFSGAMTAQDFIKVKSSFTPDPMVAQTTEEMLKPSEQDLQVTNIIDGRTLLGLLLNISYWSQISGRAVYGDLQNNPGTGKPHMPGDSIKEMKKKNKAADTQWDKWKAERKQPSNIPKEQQPPGLETPDITEIQKPKQ